MTIFFCLFDYNIDNWVFIFPTKGSLMRRHTWQEDRKDPALGYAGGHLSL